MSNVNTGRKFTIPGIVTTIIATFFFIWAAMQWFTGYNWPPQADIDEIQSNELHAFKNLKFISDTQKKYIELEWDKDAEKAYADYFVHLWTSVNTRSEPVKLNLIPRELGFAMGPTRAVDGYYFIDIHERISPDTGKTEWLDFKKQWMIAAVPSDMIKSGKLMFLADQTGSIYVKAQPIHPKEYIDSPLSQGWSKIDSIRDLKEFQQGVDYTH